MSRENTAKQGSFSLNPAYESACSIRACSVWASVAFPGYTIKTQQQAAACIAGRGAWLGDEEAAVDAEATSPDRNQRW